MTIRNLNSKLFIALLLFIGLFSWFSPNVIKISHAIEVTPETIVEMNDVVIVNYTLWIVNDRMDDQEGTVYVADPDELVPGSIIEEFPDIRVPPNVGFRKALLGMKAGETKDVPIAPEEGFTNISDPFYGRPLFYNIRLIKILLDATVPQTTLLDLPFFIPLVILVCSIIILLVILRIQRYSRTHNLFGLKTKCFNCENIAVVKCGNLDCNVPYCKRCFFKNNRCDVCGSNTIVPLKKRT